MLGGPWCDHGVDGIALGNDEIDLAVDDKDIAVGFRGLCGSPDAIGNAYIIRNTRSCISAQICSERRVCTQRRYRNGTSGNEKFQYTGHN